ncbi:MAG: hypothetical protein MR308_05270 [Lachnospiraceae bacterium]|nr:hypothetical protein [Lachnospiraceae bacterium]
MTNKTNSANRTRNDYDDGNIPDVDLPSGEDTAEPLPESARSGKDVPGGEVYRTASLPHKCF